MFKYVLRARISLQSSGPTTLRSNHRSSIALLLRGFHERNPSPSMSIENSISASTDPSADTGFARFDNILKSEGDFRQYRGVVLDNGMKAMLISDPTTDKSAAAMSVQVGFLLDPDNLPGLAHFCEHMLFLGTEKYPDENEYTKFLSANGGSSNACTYADTTKFYFEVKPEKLTDALDRFSQFFIAPLFTESATFREIQAVDSEHEKNLTTDVWRIRQVNKELADPKHPFRKFGTGNKATLCDIPKASGVDVREELIKFHQEWYSANLMCLAVVGKESLDELEDTVVKQFSGIVNKDVTPVVWSSKLYTPDKLGTLTSIVPVKDLRNLTISFQMEDLDKHYKSGPEHYLSHLIGHESKGSILSELKRLELCNSLVGGYMTSGRGFGFFEINVELTEKGFAQTDLIIKTVFQYINLLKREGPQQRIFNECSQISNMSFRFKDKETPLTLVSGLVHALQLYPMAEVLSGPYLVNVWRPDLVTSVLDCLFPENARFILIGKALEATAQETEPVYGTRYSFEKIPNSKMVDWSNCGLNDNLALPEPNPFIPVDLEVKPYEGGNEYPTIVGDDSLIRVWFKQDKEFLKPKACITVDLSSPLAYSDPMNCNLTHMFVQLIKDELNEFLYDAELAGLKLAVSNTTYGISIGIGGYNEKQHVLLEKVLKCMFDFKVDKVRFEILKEQYIRGLRNFKAEQPWTHAIFYLSLLLSEVSWSKPELLESAELITHELQQEFVETFKKKLHMECFIYGNYRLEEALNLAELASGHLKKAGSLPLSSRQLLLKREIKLADGDSFLFQANHESHKSNCTELYLQVGMQSKVNNVLTDLVIQIMQEPCYDQLRTKEQLGYIVFCGSRRSYGSLGIRIIVQSNRHPAYVEQRIFSFLGDMRGNIESLSEKAFEDHKLALAVLKLEKPKRLSTQFARYQNEISSQQFNFNREISETSYLQTVTKEQLLEFYDRFVMEERSRRSLVFYVISPECPEQTEETDGEAFNSARQEILDLTLFKSSNELYSNVQPYIAIEPKGARSKL